MKYTIRDRNHVNEFWAVSDLHLHPSRPAGIEHFRAFLNEASRYTPRLMILGDLFDYWIGPYDFHRGEFEAVFSALRHALKQGLRISFVAGNRDFLVRNDLKQKLNVPTYRDQLPVHGNDDSWLGVHGDTLCHHDTSYQFYRRMIQTNWIGEGIRRLPNWCKRRLIRDLRQISESKIERMEGPDENFSRYRIRCLLGHEYQHLICGHVHYPGHHTITVKGQERSIWILGDWIEPKDCVFFIAEGGHSQLETF